MKYISVVIVLALMIWTWSLASKTQAFSVQQHVQVEIGVEQDIASFIQSKYPESTEIYCPHLFTEVTQDPTVMVARFRCQANGPMTGGEETEQVFEGYLNLKSEDGFKTWAATDGRINSPEIRFRNGVRVTPGQKGDETAAPDTQGARPESSEDPQAEAKPDSQLEAQPGTNGAPGEHK